MIKIEEFQRVQNEVLRYKQENHDLSEQLKGVSAATPTFLQSLFSSSENAEIDRLQKEESDLKKSLSSILEANEAIQLQCKGFDMFESEKDQIRYLENLFLTKKRELTRMKELNAATVSDLEEEVNLAQELCDSLESGRVSLNRDKESLENSILSLKGVRQSLDARINDLKQLNQKFKLELGVKEVQSKESEGACMQTESLNHKLEELERENAKMFKEFDDDENMLRQKENEKMDKLNKINEQNNVKTNEIENALKSLRQELQALKRKETVSKTVEIDVDVLIQENNDIKSRNDELDVKKKELSELVFQQQVDCNFLVQWLKKERSHKDSDTIFKELIQMELNLKDELEKLQNR